MDDVPVFEHGDWVQVYIDPVPGGPGHIRIRESHGAPGVVILPIAGRKVGLVTTFRRAVRTESVEAPRGFGGESASTIADAARELFEETGISVTDDSAAKLVELGSVWPNSAILDATPKLYAVVLPEAPATSPVDTAEISRFDWYDVDDVLAMIREDIIKDGFTQAVVFRALLAGHLAVAIV